MDGAKLSRCASELLGLMELIEQTEREIDAYHAPGECLNLAMKGIRADAERVLKKYGYEDLEQFEEELAERTTEKFVFNMCFDTLVE